ncbi:hypothetical protein GN958_ATG19855 [Phytophthora infestans]|uniref:Uncharacterized protein n=1 Tax=Phytophthora infestans TaxID=4787 RepID=A0A8S9TTU7_PHYIN|nr:hypothetical protein GN958_ATG19855 [Phytophthora infestans]
MEGTREKLQLASLLDLARRTRRVVIPSEAVQTGSSHIWRDGCGSYAACLLLEQAAWLRRH